MEREGLSMEEKDGTLQIRQELWPQICTPVLLLSLLSEPSCFAWSQPPFLLMQGCSGTLRYCLGPGGDILPVFTMSPASSF